MGPVKTNKPDQLFPDAVSRRVREVLVKIVQHVHRVDSQDAGGPAQLGLAPGGQLFTAAERRIADPARVAPRRGHERNRRPAIHVAAGESSGRKAFVVWMRENQQDPRLRGHAANGPGRVSGPIWDGWHQSIAEWRLLP